MKTYYYMKKKHIRFSILILTLLLSAHRVFAATEDYSGGLWTDSIKLVINTTASGANVTGSNLINFPVLVRLNPSNFNGFAAVRPGGADIRFARNGRHLSYHIERWVDGPSNADTAEIWVKLDTVYKNNNTQMFTMYWGNSAATDASDSHATFDVANGFVAVYHHNQSSGSVIDVTGNGLNGTAHGSITYNQIGDIGKANGFNGNGTWFDAGNSSKFNFSANDVFTVSAWVYRSGSNVNGVHEGIAGSFEWTSGNYRSFCLINYPSDGFNFHVSSDGTSGSETILNSNFMPANGTWYHVTSLADGSRLRIYVNGVERNNVAYSNNIYYSTNSTFKIGIMDDNGDSYRQYWNGKIDEVRVEKVARSADWIKLSYENQKTGSTVISSINPPSGLAYSSNPAYYTINTAIPNNIPALSGGVATSYSVSPALPAGLTLNPSTGVISGTPTAAAALTQYTVNAANASGVTSVTLSLAVTAGSTAPGATATGGTLTCANTSVVLTGSSPTAGVTYSWTGPNSFTSASQNPVVSTAGTYTLTVTNPANGGISIATATVTQNINIPDVSATGGILPYSGSITLTAGSSVSGATYYWTGPNGFTSSLQNPTVSTAGTYTVTVTNPSNGCTASQSVAVTSESTPTVLWLEDFTLPENTTVDNGSTAWSRTYNGTTGQSHVHSDKFVSDYLGTESVWTSEVIDISSSCNVTVSIDVKGEGSLDLNEDYFRAYYILDGGSEVLFINHNQSGPFDMTTTTSPSLNGSTLQIVVKEYCTGSTEIYRFDNVKVSGNELPTVTASVSGPLTCSSVTLLGSSGTPGVIYNWSGPNGFTSSEQNPTVDTPGTYTLTVSNGFCSATAQVTVNQNTTSILWLEDFSGLSNGTTVDNGATAWTRTYSGSTGHWYVQSNQFEGVYIKSEAVWRSQVINIASFSSVTISMDVTGEGSLNVNDDYFRAYYILNGGSEVPFISYNQDGAFGPATSTSPALTGSTLQIVVRAYNTYSDEIYRFDNVKVTGINTITATASVNGTLSCANTSVTLSGSSNTSGVTYSWSGPNGFVSSAQNPTVSTAGTYTLTVTNPSNGCTSVATVNVTSSIGISTVWLEDFQDLADYVTVDNGPTAWIRDASNMASGYLEVRDHRFVSHCTDQDLETGMGVWQSAVINISSYSGVTLSVDISSGGSLDAGQDYIKVLYKLNGGTETLFTNGFKDGPFTAGTVVTPTLTGNTIQIIIRTKSTGDSEFYYFDNVKVSGNSGPLTATASVSGPLTCTTTTVTLSGSSNTPGVTYSWSGPDNFTSTLQNPSVSTAGTYTLLVTNPANGCTATATAGVTSDTTAPGATTTGGTINCNNASVTLAGNSSTPGVTYSWSGPNSFSSTAQNPTVSMAGTYYLTVTNPVNECTFAASASVTSDTDAPGAAATGGTITCSNASIVLEGTSPTSGVTYNWSGPGDFASAAQNPTVTIAGTYKLTVTDPANGCTSADSVLVDQNTTVPDVTATGTSLPCSGSVSITGNSSVTGAVFNWTGPDDFVSNVQNPTVSATGVYTLTVTDPVNGCTASDTAIVTPGPTVPGVTATASGPITCNITSVTLSGNAGISGVTFNWSGPGDFMSSLQNPTANIPGTYTLTVTNPENGCIATATANVAADTIEPGASASGGTITCSNATVTLSGSSSVPGATYSWSGPNSFASTSQNPVVSVTGTYALTVTNTTNGCTSTATANVGIDTTSPGASATGGTITCSNGSVTLAGSSSTPGVTYNWSGPNDFASTAQNPAVSIAGTYTLTVTNPGNGCTSTDSADVIQDTPVPGAIAGGGGTITCTVPSVTITGSSPTPGVNYSWSGPDDFTSSLQNPSVTTGGQYTLTVTNPENGCISTATVSVSENTTLPGATATGGILTCITDSVTLSGSSSTPEVTYSWSGPGNFASTQQNPSVNAEGPYLLTVTNPVNGCVSTATASVEQDIAAPGATATGGSITCFTSTVTLSGNSGTPGVSYNWSGPDNFASSLQNPTVNKLGNYTVTVTNPVNGCTSTATTSVTENTAAPEVTVTVSGPITCSDTSAILSANTGIPGLTYNWTGPGGFSSALQNPSVSLPGIYTLAVTNPVNSCSSTKTVNVQQDKTKPGVEAWSNGTLTCGTTSVSLTASSATPNATFSWGGFPAGQNPVSTSSPGKYYVTATNPSNGCKSIDSAVVDQEISYTTVKFVYNDFYDYTSGTISDNSTNGWYLDRSQVPDVTSVFGSNITPHYFAIHSHRLAAQQLEGQGIWYSKVMDVAGKPNFKIGIKITSEGTLNSDEYVKLYYKVNGGSAVLWDQRTGYFGTIDFRSPVLNANIIQIIVKFYNYGKGGEIVSNYYLEEEQLYIGGCGVTLEVYPSVSGSITCANSSATLSATASHSGATYQWSGPNGFTSTQQHPVVSNAGTYYVTATVAPSSIASGSVSVGENIVSPDVSAGVSDTLTCSRTFVTLSGYSSVPGVTYKWSGPDGFVSSVQNPAVTVPGTYTLTVTNPVNGCSSVSSVNVAQNTTIPGASASVEDTLTCLTTSVTITGNFTTSGVTYSWTGPGNFTSDLQSPAVSVPGLYTLVVTDPVSGCTSTAFADVIQNSTTPGASATGGSLSCNASTVVLSGDSPTPGVTYSWAGPGNFSSSLKNPVVSADGTYTLTVTNPVNGCTSTATAIVTQNDTLPEVTVTGEDITCLNPSATLTGSSSVQGVTYRWTGPDGFTSNLQNINVTLPGKYVLEVESTASGCIGKDSVTITRKIDEPDLSVSPVDELTCRTTTVTLRASSATPGVTFAWNGFANGENPVSVSDSGLYVVTVTNNANGCTKKDSLTVTQNNTPPGAMASGNNLLTCTVTSTVLTASSPTPGVRFTWTGPNGYHSSMKNTVTSVQGEYILTVNNPINGCLSADTIEVVQNNTPPENVTATAPGSITCAQPGITLTGSSGTSGVTYGWTGPNGFSSAEQNPFVTGPGIYTLVVTDPTNDCSASAAVTAEQNILPPAQVRATVSGVLTCAVTIVTLNGSSASGGVNYSWSGPGNFTSFESAPGVSVPGTYTLTITDMVNGCSETAFVTVEQNIDPPSGLTASVSDTLSCTVNSVILSASSVTAGVTYTWEGPQGFGSNEQNTVTSLPGNYTVTATDPVNSCTAAQQVTVIEEPCQTP